MSSTFSSGGIQPTAAPSMAQSLQSGGVAAGLTSGKNFLDAYMDPLGEREKETMGMAGYRPSEQKKQIVRRVHSEQHIGSNPGGTARSAPGGAADRDAVAGG